MEIILPQKTFHAVLWILGDCWVSLEDDERSHATTDHFLSLADKAQTDDSTKEYLEHCGMPHPCEPWDLRR